MMVDLSMIFDFPNPETEYFNEKILPLITEKYEEGEMGEIMYTGYFPHPSDKKEMSDDD